MFINKLLRRPLFLYFNSVRFFDEFHTICDFSMFVSRSICTVRWMCGCLPDSMSNVTGKGLNVCETVKCEDIYEVNWLNSMIVLIIIVIRFFVCVKWTGNSENGNKTRAYCVRETGAYIPDHLCAFQQKVVAQRTLCVLPSLRSSRNWTCAIEMWTDFTWKHSTIIIYYYCWLRVCARSSKPHMYYYICFAAGGFVECCAHFHKYTANNVLHETFF